MLEQKRLKKFYLLIPQLHQSRLFHTETLKDSSNYTSNRQTILTCFKQNETSGFGVTRACKLSYFFSKSIGVRLYWLQ